MNTVKKSSNILRLKYYEILTRMMFLEESEIPLANEHRFNPIFGMSSQSMKKKFGITQEDLNKKYDFIEDVKMLKR